MKIYNRKFNRDFEKVDEYEAGISLTGAEVKSIREGRIKLEDSHVKLIDGQPFLINAEIFRYKFAPSEGYESTRSRRLLLTKPEILRIKTKLASAGRLTIVPIACYNKGNLIKLKIALVRGRRDIEKRKLEKARVVKRNQQKELKEYIKK